MTPLVGTSLKMNLTSSEARVYFDALRPLLARVHGCELFVLPPFTSLWVARERLARSNIAWGAQDVHADDSGAHTGDVSASMLTDLGCTFVEVGHSERRRDHSETDERVAAKVRQILRHRMTPIMCVGELTKATVASGLAQVLPQVRAGLKHVPPAERSRVVIAYEPVWAIGEGSTPAEPDHVAAVHRGIHEFMLSTAAGGVDCRVIYGGSVDPETAGPLLDQAGVDGLFVGRAALDPVRFAAIAAAAETLAAP
ncbi:MAG: triose-phosphate isomerase [Candidatus Dormibacterales bacterium]